MIKYIPLVFAVSLIPYSCKTLHVIRPTLQEYQALNAVQVDFSDLIVHKEKFHGKVIETSGYYRTGFERSKLILDTLPFSWTKNEDILPYYSELWIEFHPSISYKVIDSLNNRLLKVRGVFDTSLHGHMGAYYAEIRDVFYAEPLKK